MFALYFYNHGGSAKFFSNKFRLNVGKINLLSVIWNNFLFFFLVNVANVDTVHATCGITRLWMLGS